jgi:cellobiose phosphorylase
MYRVAVEYILGIRLQGDALSIDPVIHSNWPGFEATFRHGDATYQIVVENPERQNRGVAAIIMDGATLNPQAPIPLTREAGTHQVKVTLGTLRKG